ncbi:MAG: hypothetical protein Q4C76_06710 [Bacillota bacterium]|nr:hypothetical protein [Bacillota bacterium]
MKNTKKRDLAKTKPEEQKQRDAILLMISVGFLCGAVLGGLAEGKLSAEPYVLEFLQAQAREAVTPALWRELWVIFRWPAAVIALSFLPLVGLTMTALFFLRGFLLSYGIIAFAAGSGAQGMLWAGLLFGPTCILTIPVMFVLGTACLLKKTGSDKAAKAFPLRLLLCVPALALCVFLNNTVVPPVLHFFLQTLSVGT